MSLSLRQLEYFVAAGEFGSIKQAALNVNISQPAISSAIAHLESELKLQLFVRHHAQGLSLTSAGRRMMRESKLMLKQMHGLYSIAAELKDEVSGSLSVGCMVTLAPMIAPELGHSFTCNHNAAKIDFIEGSHDSLLLRLKQVQIDVAITYDLMFSDDIVFEPLAELPPQVLLPEKHKLAKKAEVSLQQLADQPMVLLDLPQSREYFLSLFESKNLQVNIASRASSQEVVRTMVANGFGFSITNVRPKNLTAMDGRRLALVNLAGKHKPMRIGIATLGQVSKPGILQAFEAHCRSLISNNGIPGMAAL